MAKKKNGKKSEMAEVAEASKPEKKLSEAKQVIEQCKKLIAAGVTDPKPDDLLDPLRRAYPDHEYWKKDDKTAKQRIGGLKSQNKAKIFGTSTEGTERKKRGRKAGSKAKAQPSMNGTSTDFKSQLRMLKNMLGADMLKNLVDAL